MSIKKYINESTFKTYKYFVKRYELIPTPNTFRMYTDVRITKDSRRLNYLRIERIYMCAERRIPGSLSEGTEEAQRDRGAPENGDLRGRRGCGWLRGS